MLQRLRATTRRKQQEVEKTGEGSKENLDASGSHIKPVSTGKSSLSPYLPASVETGQESVTIQEEVPKTTPKITPAQNIYERSVSLLKDFRNNLESVNKRQKEYYGKKGKDQPAAITSEEGVTNNEGTQPKNKEYAKPNCPPLGEEIKATPQAWPTEQQKTSDRVTISLTKVVNTTQIGPTEINPLPSTNPGHSAQSNTTNLQSQKVNNINPDASVNSVTDITSRDTEKQTSETRAPQNETITTDSADQSTQQSQPQEANTSVKAQKMDLQAPKDTNRKKKKADILSSEQQPLITSLLNPGASKSIELCSSKPNPPANKRYNRTEITYPARNGNTPNSIRKLNKRGKRKNSRNQGQSPVGQITIWSGGEPRDLDTTLEHDDTRKEVRKLDFDSSSFLLHSSPEMNIISPTENFDLDSSQLLLELEASQYDLEASTTEEDIEMHQPTQGSTSGLIGAISLQIKSSIDDHMSRMRRDINKNQSKFKNEVITSIRSEASKIMKQEIKKAKEEIHSLAEGKIREISTEHEVRLTKAEANIIEGANSLKQINETLTTLLGTLQFLSDVQEEHETWKSAMEKAEEEKQKDREKLQTVIQTIQEEKEKMEERIGDNERKLRERNIRICGTPEKEPEGKTSEYVAELILRHNLLPGYDDKFGVQSEMELCYRIGPKKQGTTRPILVRFFSREVRNTVMRRGKRYPGKERLKPTWLSDDLSPTDQASKQEANSFMDKIHNTGMYVRFEDGHVKVERKKIDKKKVQQFNKDGQFAEFLEQAKNMAEEIKQRKKARKEKSASSKNNSDSRRTKDSQKGGRE